jgi:hypothetical protein
VLFHVPYMHLCSPCLLDTVTWDHTRTQTLQTDDLRDMKVTLFSRRFSSHASLLLTVMNHNFSSKMKFIEPQTSLSKMSFDFDFDFHLFIIATYSV